MEHALRSMTLSDARALVAAKMPAFNPKRALFAGQQASEAMLAVLLAGTLAAILVVFILLLRFFFKFGHDKPEELSKAVADRVHSCDRAAKSPPKMRSSPSQHKGQYIKINGVNYDRSIIDIAHDLKSMHTKLGKADATKVWRDAKDGSGVTDIERLTIKYVIEHLDMTREAKEFLQEMSELETTGSQYYGRVQGRLRSDEVTKTDRKLWERIHQITKDGTIDLADAKRIWTAASDAGVITATEVTTIKRALAQVNLTQGARDFLAARIETIPA